MRLNEWRVVAADAGHGLRSRPGRTAFAVSALAVGMAALTLLVATMDGLRRRSRDVIREFGADLIAVVDSDGPVAGFREMHRHVVQAALPGCRVAPVRRHLLPAHAGVPSIELIGAGPQLLDVRRWRMEQGRWLDPLDLTGAERHAVISRALARRGNHQLGDTVLLERTPFRVIGVVDTREAEGNLSAFVPLSVVPVWERRGNAVPSGYTGLFVQAREGMAPERMERIVRRLLSQPGLQGGARSWITPDQLLHGVRRLQWTVRLTVGTVAVLALLLGGMTLGSLLAANVRERVPEIGLRRALGATGREIAQLFLLEAMIIIAAAAGCGTAIGWTLLVAAQPVWPAPIHPTLWTLAAPPVIGLLLGGLFAYGPARLATAIPPAEALRNP